MRFRQFLFAKIAHTKLPNGADFAYPPGLAGITARLNPPFRWQSDFPVEHQKDAVKRPRIFDLEFEVNQSESESLKAISKDIIGSSLSLRLEFGETNLSISVMQDVNRLNLDGKELSLVCEQITEKFRFTYVPAIRTTKQIQDILESLIESEMALLKNNSKYLEALTLIREIEDPELQRISSNISATINKFVPTVREIKIVAATRNLQFNRNSSKFWIDVDDGIVTPIENKGDGIKSLIAISLMRDHSSKKHGNYDTLVAIEEPEAHLHPSAIRELRYIIQQISEVNQVIVSTHSPLFAYLADIKRNIVVRANEASPAKSFNEIRIALGVIPSDNLSSAEVVLLVEGANDVRSLRALIESKSEFAQAALLSGRLVIKELGGASSLAYQTNMYQSTACLVHAFLDNDEEGRNAVRNAVDRKFISERDYNLSIVQGYENSEFEDLLTEDVYAEKLRQEFAVDIKAYNNVSKKEKWSKRMETVFGHSGKIWDDSLLNKIKSTVSLAVTEAPAMTIHPKCAGSLNSLILQIETKLGKQQSLSTSGTGDTKVIVS